MDATTIKANKRALKAELKKDSKRDGKKVFNRIGVLTSGGDAPGMNAALRAVTRAAKARGIEVVAIRSGYKGLLENDLSNYTSRDVSNIINRSGTVIYTDRCDEFKELRGQKKALKNCKLNEIDGIVAIGGDGTFRGALDLTRMGIPAIGIPATIDNDISATDYSIGFDTAMNTVVEMVDRLRDTCESHARCNVVEVMGRHAGYIALESGIAVGAIGIAVSELSFNKAALLKKIKQCKRDGKRSFIVIASEGMNDIEPNFCEILAKDIQRVTGVETKFARLAHVQRGGSPTLRDRLMASKMGSAAVDLLVNGKSNLVVGYVNGEITSIDINYALTYDRLVKGKMTNEEAAAMNPSVLKKMQAAYEKKHKAMKELAKLADEISR